MLELVFDFFSSNLSLFLSHINFSFPFPESLLNLECCYISSIVTRMNEPLLVAKFY